MRMWTRAVWLGAIGLAAGISVGCAEEREPINRVQPNALTKSFFVGDDLQDTADDPAFYARAVITDVGYGAAQDGLFTSTYAQPLAVMKWEITEDLLIGRLIYNRIDGSDEHGDGPADIDGQVAYAFPITSHFDIKRDYNPTTGEESNVINENTSDSPWYARKYFRVDWSRNLNTDAYDFDTLSQVGVYGGISYEPLAYWQTDPNHPDAAHFAFDEGYFDITNKAFASPGVIDLSHLGWGIDSFPACYLPNDILGGSAPFGNCNPVELTLRFSFKRVVKSDYEPVDWTEQFTSYGIFYDERHGYDRGYGITDSKWRRFASRYNIWDWSHHYEDASGDACPSGYTLSGDFAGKCELRCYTEETTPVGEDPARDADGNGTSDECEAAGAGSQCDPFEHKCTEPYAKRTEKPIVWHFTKDSNNKYYDGTEWATHEWDVAMRTAVQVARYAECARVTQGDVASVQAACLSTFPMYTGQQEENEDAVALARDVDDCRAARGGWATDDGGSAAWSEGRLTYCAAQADTIGAARGNSAGVIAIAKMDEMVTLCHSPLQGDDSPECVKDIQKAMTDAGKSADTRQVLPAEITAEQCETQWGLRYSDPDQVDDSVIETCDNGFFVRMGDLRYHQVNVIKNPQTPSPWGIMVDTNDPRTGEKVQASINVWSHVNDLAAQGLVDTLRYIAGEISTEEVTDGTYVRDWTSAVTAAGGKGALGTMDKKTLDARKLGMFDGRSFENGTPRFDPENLPELPEALKQKAREVNKKIKSIRADAETISVNRPYTDARRQAALDTTTEAALITPEMMQLAGMNRSEMNAAQSEIQAGSVGQSAASASILRTLNPQIRRDLRNARELGLAKRGACILSSDEIMAPAPNTLANLGNVIGRKFGPFDPNLTKDEQFKHANIVRDFLAQRFQHGVIIHEMGHSIGERHNFVSSYFAWGYRPQYWQLRTKDGKVTQQCGDVDATGENCVGPRYFDPPTKEEKENMIEMWQQSSVMDYPGEITQDMLGLGAYDFAAARMFYGQAVAVFADSDYNAGKAKSKEMLNLTDGFGGIVGIQYIDSSGANMHYSALQDELTLVDGCVDVDPAAFKPKGYNEAKYGAWDSLIDGLIVTVGGKTTRCKSTPVDYVPYSSLRQPLAGELGDVFLTTGRRAIDQNKRTKVPYGFATDGWADLGNLSVYRHDNGADPYELFNFFITEQETRHIFDNYRRDRTSFSVRSQSGRILERYNEKMRDGAKGLGLLANIYRELLVLNGSDFDAGTGAVLFNFFFADNMLASGIAFDHFTKQFQRPESGEHQIGCQSGSLFGGCPVIESDRVLRSTTDYNGGDTGIMMNVFNGATGYFDMVAFGGKLVENQLADGKGEFDRDYTMNAGQYYDKVYAPYLLTESADNFISDSLGDFVDPRYRAVSMADLFPDGYRRFLANNLTPDDWLKGSRVAASGGASSTPLVDGDGFPTQGLGFTTWWTPEVTTCFPAEGRIACAQYGCPDGSVCKGSGNLAGPTDVVPIDNPDAPASVLAVDPQVGFEQWKWLIAQTLLYLPENQKTQWIDMLGIWEIGADNDPGFENRIELHLPNGRVYVARTYGTEVIFGRTVQRGVAARVLEYANGLLAQAYETTTVTQNGVTWYVPVITNGSPVVRFDPNVPDTVANCNAGDNTGCTCSSNQSCVALGEYQSLPTFIRQSLHDFRMADASMQGIYD